MLALAGTKALPGVIVPGGVTLPARGAEDAGQVQSLGQVRARSRQPRLRGDDGLLTA
jgi:hypothetical protein